MKLASAVGATPQSRGKAWEDVFHRRANSNGYMVIQNFLTSIRTATGFRVVKSELDFKLVRRSDGRIGYFDCKTYAKDSFSFSELKESQVKRSRDYNECNVPSGFIVWFRSRNAVKFFSGKYISDKGAGSSFSANEGIPLGRLESFDVHAVMLSRAQQFTLGSPV